MMPDGGGMAFHAALLRLGQEHADRIVFMTGGAFTASSREFLAETSRPCIDKPIVTLELQAVLERLLTEEE